jgi:hypothetical protein
MTMSETHQITGDPCGEPLAAGRVGARVRVPLSGTPGPRWSHALSAHLAHELIGHSAVGHLHINEVVQGRDLVLDGVEPREAPALGDCLQRAVDAANRACAHVGEAPLAANMDQPAAEAIARQVEIPG